MAAAEEAAAVLRRRAAAWGVPDSSPDPDPDPDLALALALSTADDTAMSTRTFTPPTHTPAASSSSSGSSSSGGLGSRATGGAPQPPHQQSGMAVDAVPCPICSARMTMARVERHLAHAHGIQDSQDGQGRRAVAVADGVRPAMASSSSSSSCTSAAAGGSRAGAAWITCEVEHCRQPVPLDQLAAHQEQHSLELAQALAAQSFTPPQKGVGTQRSQKRRRVGDGPGSGAAASAGATVPSVSFTDYGQDSFAKTDGCVAELIAACRRSGKPDAQFRISSYKVAHYKQSDRFSCGYRNIQILSAALLEDHRDLLFSGLGHVPTVPGIQRAIEAAWKDGFDVFGAGQLGFKLTGTKKWIGATECATLLRFFGLDAKLVDFYAKGEQGEQHRELVDWVWRYFHPAPSTSASGLLRTSKGNVVLAHKPPLYFQHQGHSRTIVGIEKRGGGMSQKCFLLILDPACPGEKLKGALARGRWEKLVKRGVHTLRMKQYQLVYVDGTMDARERQQSKRLAASAVFGKQFLRKEHKGGHGAASSAAH